MLEVLPQSDAVKTLANPFGGGMDWLEVRLPEDANFRPVVQDIIRDDRSKHRSSEHYGAVVDLRKYGVADACLHFSKKRGDNTHKIQLIGTGQYSWRQNVADIEAIVDCDPMNLQPMRTDLTADVRDVPMSWVHQHVTAEHKRFACSVSPDLTPRAEQTDKEALLVMGSRGIETVYIGKKPNCFRFYNKTAERMNAYRKFTRGWHAPEPTMKRWLADINAKRTGAAFIEFERECLMQNKNLHPEIFLADAIAQRLTPENLAILEQMHDAWAKSCAEKGSKPTFTEFCGLHEGDCITRFERMMGAQEVKRVHLVGDKRKVPLFRSLRELRDNVAEFNPFSPISFAEAGHPEPPLPKFSNGRYSLMDYAALMFFREQIMRHGMQTVEATYKPHASGHWDDRIMSKLRELDFLPPDTTGAADVLTPASLFERYRNAVTTQLAA